MENKRTVVWALLAAVLAAVLFFFYVKLAVSSRTKEFETRVRVLKSKQTIPANTRIEAGMFDEVDWPTAFLPPKAAERADQVIGQVAIATIFQGEPILTSKLVPFDESALDRRIPEGHRAVTIGLSDSQNVPSVGGNLRPGQLVDILVTMYVSTKELEKGPQAILELQAAQNLKAETRTFLQAVKILAVGRDSRIATANVNRSADVPIEASTLNVTVALKPADAQRLILAQQVGRIVLTLRRFNDSKEEALAYTDPFQAFGIKLPVVSGPSPAYREIRGGQVFSAPY